MDAKTHYETYWNKKNKQEDFFAYERNWAIPGLFTKKGKVLDLGCGDGAVAHFLQEELGMEVIAADISEQALKVAQKRGLKVKKIDVEQKLPFKDKYFDAVFWGDNVEHLFDPESTLKEIHRVLKKNGRIILSCPNMGYWRYRLHYFVKGRLPDTEWTGNSPWGWSHIRFFSFSIMNDFLTKNKFKKVKIIGVNRSKIEGPLLSILPSFFGRILIAEARK